MICPMLIVALCLALIVLMGGLFLLAYSKKEGLGKLTKIASYVAIVFGTAVFVGGLICAIMCSTCKNSKCDKDKKDVAKIKWNVPKMKNVLITKKNVSISKWNVVKKIRQMKRR